MITGGTEAPLSPITVACFDAIKGTSNYNDDPEHVLAMKETGERRDVKLSRAIPLYFVYITAWATEDGVIQFRRDIYQKDGIGALASAY